MMDIKDLRRQGLTVTRIAEITGRDRKTVRKYIDSSEPPAYTPRAKGQSKLDPFKPYIRARMEDGMVNGAKMLTEIVAKDYSGKKSILLDFMHPLRAPKELAIMRFETEPGLQAQVDWGHCGRIFHEGRLRPLYCFVMTLSYSRYMYVEFTTSQDTTSFLRCHTHAFEYFGGVTKEILYDNTKSAIIRRFFEKVELNSRFADMAAHFCFVPRFCKPYRAQTKGKVESAIKYVKGNFLLGEHFSSLDEINLAVHTWLAVTANTRIHGTTGMVPLVRFASEELAPIMHAFDVSEQTYRRATLDCMVSYKGARYSVPHKAARAIVAIKEDADGSLRIFLNGERIAKHRRALRGETILVPEHYYGIALIPARQAVRTPIHGLMNNTPSVQVRDLSVYEGVTS